MFGIFRLFSSCCRRRHVKKRNAANPLTFTSSQDTTETKKTSGILTLGNLADKVLYLLRAKELLTYAQGVKRQTLLADIQKIQQELDQHVGGSPQRDFFLKVIKPIFNLLRQHPIFSNAPYLARDFEIFFASIEKKIYCTADTFKISELEILAATLLFIVLIDMIGVIRTCSLSITTLNCVTNVISAGIKKITGFMGAHEILGENLLRQTLSLAINLSIVYWSTGISMMSTCLIGGSYVGGRLFFYLYDHLVKNTKLDGYLLPKILSGMLGSYLHSNFLHPYLFSESSSNTISSATISENGTFFATSKAETTPVFANTSNLANF